MVQTLNRVGAGLILPGGLVEEGESPAEAAAREVAEEVGLDVVADRLLAVEHQAESDGRPANLQFVFTARLAVAEDASLALQPEEVAEACWVDRGNVVQRHVLAGQSRMAAALRSLDSGIPVYLET